MVMRVMRIMRVGEHRVLYRGLADEPDALSGGTSHRPA
jgi:hypothetical protein